MKNEIEQIIVNHIDRKISLGEATTQILRLFAVGDTVCDYCNSYEKLSPYLYCPYCGKKYEGKSQTGR